MGGIFSRLFSSKKKPSTEEQLEELQGYLIKVENLFFESSFVHTLKPDHRKTLLVTLRLFYPGKDYNEASNRHYVYNFIANWYKYTDKEMQEHCEKYPIDNLFDIFNDLPTQSKIAIMLLINCILYIDNNATAQQKKIATSIYTIMEISPQLYTNIMTEFGEITKDKWFSHIHSHPF